MRTVQAGMQGATPAMAVAPVSTFDHPPSDEFLAELRYRARKYGHSGDYTEVIEFLRSLYKESNRPLPNMEPFPERER